MLAEYNDGIWATDYIYLHGEPIAKLWAENRYTGDTLTDTVSLPPINSFSMTTMGAPPTPPPGYVTDYEIYYFHNDHLGTPLALTDDNKTIRWKGSYYPFGARNTEYVSTVNNIRFPGQYHDRETDNHFNMFRHYSPRLGRFLNADPLGLNGGINYYSYAGNNPINAIDPLGLYSWIAFGHDVAHHLIAIGDVATLGGTKKLRNWMWGPDCYTDESSVAYQTGRITGFVASSLTGLGGGIKVSLSKLTKYKTLGATKSGMEFSHWIPTRYFKKLGLLKYDKKTIWNGNHVTKLNHTLHDPFRNGIKGLTKDHKWPFLIRQIDRIPITYKGFLIGMGWGRSGYLLTE